MKTLSALAKIPRRIETDPPPSPPPRSVPPHTKTSSPQLMGPTADEPAHPDGPRHLNECVSEP